MSEIKSWLKEPLIKSAVWLSFAQDCASSGGVPAAYRMGLGWAAPYPETTGYIIPTFLHLSKILEQNIFERRAIRMGEWLLSIQGDDGSFPGGVVKRHNTQSSPSIFNSGQILFGLLALSEQFASENKWLDAALRCANWICRQQETDGSWKKYAYKNTLHVYKVRVAWAIALLAKHCGDAKLTHCAKKNLIFSLSRYQDNGWFKDCSFSQETFPVLHTFAYTLQGLYELSLLLEHTEGLSKSVKSAKKLCEIQNKNGALPGIITPNFSQKISFVCLTGMAQMAIVWSRMYQRDHSKSEFIAAARESLKYLVSVQKNSRKKKLDGAFSGSIPIWGSYMRFRYPNWAAKFFIDAVIAYSGLMHGDGWG